MTPNELMDAANNGRAVSGFMGRFKPMPAAFIASMHFRDVMRTLPSLQLYHKLPTKKANERKQPAN